MEPSEWIDEAGRVGSDLRAAIREGHELLRDLRDTKREVEQLARQATREVQTEASKIFRACFDQELEKYTTDISEMSVKAIERMTNLLAAEIERAMKSLMKSSMEAIDRIAEAKGDATGPLHI